MVKPFLLALFLLALVVGGFFVKQQLSSQRVDRQTGTTANQESTGSAEAAQAALSIASSFAPSPSSSPLSQDTKQQQIDVLTKSVTDLKKRVTKLEAQKSPTPAPLTSQSSAATTVYIPLGSGGTTILTDWATITTLGAQINTGSYAGYKDMHLEVTLQSYQGNGQAFARLYNNDDGTAVLSSEASTTSQDFTLVSSPSFRLPEGEKNYRIQLKSLTGYAANIQDARIKVNF